MAEWTPNKANIMSMSYREFLTITGNEFRVNYINPSVDPGASIYLRADSPTTKYSLFTTRIIDCDVSQQRWYRVFFGDGLGFTGGSAQSVIPISSTRVGSVVSPQSVGRVWSTPTSTNNAYRTEEISLADTVQITSGSDLNQDNSLLLLPPGISLLIQFENVGAGATRFQLILKWFEVSGGFLPKMGAV